MDPNNPSQNNPNQNAGGQQPPPPQNPPQQQQSSNLMSPIKRQGIEFYRKLPFRLIIIGLSVLIILFGVFAGSAAAVVYGNAPIPFLKDKRPELMVMFYNTPFVPKNPEMILIAAVESNSEIDTYHPAFSLSADLGVGAIDSASIDLSLEGPIDMRSEDGISVDLTGQATVNAEPLISDRVEGKIKIIGKNTYLKVDLMPEYLTSLASSIRNRNNPDQELPAEIQSNLEEIYAYWISLEPDLLDTEARKSLNENSREESLIEGFKQNVNDFLLVEEILPEIERLDDEEIEGTNSYHLSVRPSKEAMRTIVTKLYESDEVDTEEINKELIDKIVNGVDNLKIDIWIGKGDALVRKASLVGSISLADASFLPLQMLGGSYSRGIRSTPDSSISLSLSVSSAVVIKNINDEVSIQAPEQTLEMQEYMTRFGEALQTEEQKQTSQQKAQYDSDLGTIRDALLRYYASYGQYPTMLDELVEAGELRPEFAETLSTYSYRINLARDEYIVYVEFTDSSSYNPTEFYGITSTFPNPSPLSERDFNLNN